jgi:hypothetical protein
MSDIESRLLLLERKYRNLQIIIYLMAVVFLPLLLIASKSSQTKIITAEQFIRLNPDGKPSLIIGDGFDNNLTFLGSNGKKQLEIGSSGGVFPHLTMYDKLGKLQIAIGVFGLPKDKDHAFFNIFNKNGEKAISLTTMFGYPFMQFFDDNGKSRFEISAGTNPSLALNNKNEKPLALLGESFTKGGQLLLADLNGNPIHSLH